MEQIILTNCLDTVEVLQKNLEIDMMGWNMFMRRTQLYVISMEKLDT